MTRRAAFIDRDGTLISERDYLSDPAGVELLPGALAALQLLHAAGWLLVVVTNQSGIARGFYGEDDYARVRQRLDELLAAGGVVLDATYHCPHHPDFTGPCDCRKPAPGMYRQAARELSIDLAGSAYIGDKLSDVEPARAFGGQGILVRTGYGSDESRRVRDDILVVADLAAAADVLMHEKREPRRGFF